MPGHVSHYLSALWSAAGGAPDFLQRVTLEGAGDFASVFPVADLAAASTAVAGLAVAEWAGASGVCVDRRLSALWFKGSATPQGWSLPPTWDAIAGDYATADGWIRLHTNAPHHRAAALRVLGDANDRKMAARLVASWRDDDLETAIVAAGGCAATMRSGAQWEAHPQGAAVAKEPLLAIKQAPAGAAAPGARRRARPLAGIRVLDCTRILAGPTATRFLAGYGANVLRLDPPGWDEPTLLAEMTLGKRCARIDLRAAAGRARFESLVASADIFIHGYRADALEALGLGDARLRALNPALIDVALNAYGWSGQWRDRRGFDSLVQMSSGIAEAGMAAGARGKPTPLPAQALDYATGYLLAAAAVRGLTMRAASGAGATMRTSLARMAALLTERKAVCADTIGEVRDEDRTAVPEVTPWGPLMRLRPPLSVEDAPMRWARGAGELGADTAEW